MEVKGQSEQFSQGGWKGEEIVVDLIAIEHCNQNDVTRHL